MTQVIDDEVTVDESSSGPRRRGPDLPDWRKSLERVRVVTSSTSPLATFLRPAVVAIVFLTVVQLFFHLELRQMIDGLALGSLYGILAVGIILIYRTNRIINFSAAAVGAVPAIYALLLDSAEPVRSAQLGMLETQAEPGTSTEVLR